MTSVERRQAQCLSNCDQWLKLHGLLMPVPLMVRSDRVLFVADTPMLDVFDSLVKVGKLSTWNAVQCHGVTARRGWREEVARGSAQLVLHGTPCGLRYQQAEPGLPEDGAIEMDFDEWNPAYGSGPMILHGLEVFWHSFSGKKTDPFKIAEIRGFRKVV